MVTIAAFRCSLGSLTPHYVAMPPYERLLAWRECHALALQVYEATKAFPADEKYGLTSQARRAAFSAAVNIVEGSAKRGAREFRRFLDISLGSLAELGYVIRLAKELGLLPEPKSSALDEQRNRAGYLTWKLYRSLSTRG